MRFSNNGSKWSPWAPYSTSKSWDLTYSALGGNAGEGTKSVYVQYIDRVGNTSSVYKDSIIYNPRRVTLLSVTKFHQNASGDDAANLNDEYFIIKNNLRGSLALSGYKIKDAQNHTYILSPNVLKAGSSAVIHSGNGTTKNGHLYLKSSVPVWDNTHDTLRIYNNDNILIKTHNY